MPKNIGKGGKSFKAGNTKGNMQHSKRELVYADQSLNEEYALVKEALGNLHLKLQLPGGNVVTGKIRGAMVRKVWIGVNDMVLISRPEFCPDGLVDVIYRYTPPEVRNLIKDGVVPRDFRGADELHNQGNANYEFVNEDEGMDEDERDNIVDRHEVQLNDPLAALDDL
eukprot:gene7089-5023_t